MKNLQDKKLYMDFPTRQQDNQAQTQMIESVTQDTIAFNVIHHPRLKTGPKTDLPSLTVQFQNAFARLAHQAATETLRPT